MPNPVLLTNLLLLPFVGFLAITLVNRHVAGWLAVEVYVFSRLRIDVYDTPYEAPSTPGDDQ